MSDGNTNANFGYNVPQHDETHKKKCLVVWIVSLTEEAEDRTNTLKSAAKSSSCLGTKKYGALKGSILRLLYLYYTLTIILLGYTLILNVCYWWYKCTITAKNFNDS